MITVKATPMMAIRLGRLGENERLRVSFDVTALQAELPGASFTIINQGPGDATAYPCPGVTVEDGTLYWPITSAELKATGRGRCELIVTVGDVVAKSIIYGTEILEALDGSGEAPEPWDSWQTEFAGMVADAQEAASEAAESVEHYPRIENGMWMVWDAQSGAFVSTGVEATGPQGNPGQKGDPGYTPQKGVDYFDGAPGEPGKDGKDGQDGYTPVKGVDYFDGQDGQDGKDGKDGADGVSPTATVSKSGNVSTLTVTDATGTTTAQIIDGADGQPGEPGTDGISPTASVSKSGNTATITITDKNGTTTATVSDGEDGTPGISPTVTVTDITGGHRITITDATGAHSFDVMDGDAADAPVQSVNGQTGAVVLDAADVGAGTYSKPSGGIPASDLAAGVIPTVPVQDVQVNGVSVLNDGVANVPVAGIGTGLGLVKLAAGNGIGFSGAGNLMITAAIDAAVKNGTNSYTPVTPSNQHAASFYGLAKAAGDSTQSQSSNAVGNYTDAAKVAIQKMLGIYEAPWELIREDTFTNETEADHIISVDSLGQAFELTDVLMVLIVPTHSEDTTIGDYGRIYLYNNTTEIRRIYLLNAASKLVQANSVPQMATGRLLNNNGLMSVDFYPWTAQSNRASFQIVPNSDSNGIGTPFAINTNYIDEIKIGKITGELMYRLYGRRKWN